jgi:hypothetical protein
VPHPFFPSQEGIKQGNPPSGEGKNRMDILYHLFFKANKPKASKYTRAARSNAV